MGSEALLTIHDLPDDGIRPGDDGTEAVGAHFTSGPSAADPAPQADVVTAAADGRARELVRIAARAAWERNASDPVAIDISSRLPLTDAFLLLTGSSERNVIAIADAVDERLAAAGAPLKRREGRGQGRWELLDFGDVVVHVFHEEDRAFYALERLWRDCPVIPLPETVAADAVSAD